MAREARVRPWLPNERRLFVEKFSLLGKNFHRIAQCMPGRTTAECVVFYYRNQKVRRLFRSLPTTEVNYTVSRPEPLIP